MLGRRFLLLVAVLMGMTALAASVAPRQPVVRQQPTPEPTRTPYAAPAASPTVRTVKRSISTDEGRRRVKVTEGQLLQLEVSGRELDSVALLDEVEPIAPEAAARFHLLADTPGRYPIELVGAGRRIGTLVVLEAG
jgi:hypothetical protein